MSAPRRQPRPLSRREFLRRAGTLSAVTAAATVWTPQLREARARTNGTVVAPQGTTLEGFIWFQDTGGELITPDGYTRLTHYEPGGRSRCAPFDARDPTCCPWGARSQPRRRVVRRCR